jgi:hypothetical protein
MRNYVQTIGTVVYDTATAQPITYIFSATQAQADQAAIDLGNLYTPPNFEIREAPYWIELNKNTVATLATSGVGILNFSFVSTTPPAKNWNSKNAGFVISPRINGTAPAIVKPGKGKGGTQELSLLDYLRRLFVTWVNGIPTANPLRPIRVPSRWIDWLKALIDHYSRYTPSQIYGFLARVDFSSKTFRV